MPFVAAEIIACEMPSISEQFFQSTAKCDALATKAAIKAPGLKASTVNDKPMLSFGSLSNSATESEKPLKLGLQEESPKLPAFKDCETDNSYELLQQMFSFLEKSQGEEDDDKLNPVLAGYFKRIFFMLLNHNPAMLFDFVYQDQHAINLLLKHMYQDSICEVLIKVLNFSNNSFAQEQDFTKSIRKIDADGETEESY